MNYKGMILDYITNNIVPTDKNYQQTFEKIELINRTAYEDYLPSNCEYFSIAGLIKSTTNGNYVLYGGFVPENETPESNSRGIIIILDADLKPIKTIYEFSSGTPLRPIQKMIQIEDETFVAIDSTIYSTSDDREKIQSNQKRFIMLNNVSAQNIAILRTSYILPYSNFYCLDMIKNPNSSHYLFAGATYIPVSDIHYDGARVIELKTLVGEENEWIDTTTDDSIYWLYGGFYGEFDEDDNASWKVILTKNESPVTVGYWTGNDFIRIMMSDGTIHPYVDCLAMKNQTIFATNDTVYFVINNQKWGSSVIARYIGLYKYTFSTKKLKEIYLKNIGNYDYNDSREGIFLTTLNGEIYVNYCNNYNKTDKTADYCYQRLEKDEWNPTIIYVNKPYRMEKTLALTGNTFNLVTNAIFDISMDSTYWYFETIKEIYNKFNYYGTAYTDYNSMIGVQGTLYGSNGILFARNLYNNTIFNSTTTSTLQIPNTYLNDATITQNKLVGATKYNLVTNNTNLTKNVYETLYINFIRTLFVKDEDTNTEYPSVANYINQNINIGTQQNCENSFIGKVQIVYENYRDLLNDVTWTYVNDHYETEFIVDARYEVPTIKFLSNDLTTLYLEKELNISPGAFYKVNQKLRIE